MKTIVSGMLTLLVTSFSTAHGAPAMRSSDADTDPPLATTQVARFAGITPESAVLLELTNTQIDTALDAIAAEQDIAARVAQAREALRVASRQHLEAKATYELNPSEEALLLVTATRQARQLASERIRTEARSVRVTALGASPESTNALLDNVATALRSGLSGEFGVAAPTADSARELKLRLVEDASDAEGTNSSPPSGAQPEAPLAPIPETVIEAQQELEVRLPTVDGIFEQH